MISHAQNTTALQPNGFLTGIHPLLVTCKGRQAFRRARHCQGQLQTPQSVTAVDFCTLSNRQQSVTERDHRNMIQVPDKVQSKSLPL